MRRPSYEGATAAASSAATRHADGNQCSFALRSAVAPGVDGTLVTAKFQSYGASGTVDACGPPERTAALVFPEDTVE